MFTAVVEADLPGELTQFGDVTTNNTSVVLRPGATLWRQTYDKGQKAFNNAGANSNTLG